MPDYSLQTPPGAHASVGGPRIAVLIAGGPLANMLVNGLRRHFGPVSVLKEEPETKLAIMRRRARLIGWSEALGQAAFGLVQKLIIRRSAGRLAEIWEGFGLDPRPDAQLTVREVGSVNSDACREALRELEPEVVVVYGTRIIKPATLRSVAAPFINYHAGINPKYRGQNGAYWARSNGDPAHAGVTVHLVDEGVDTGDVLYQATSDFAAADNIATYQHRQMATALPLLIRAVEDALAGRLAPHKVELPSRQWFHPTLWGYVHTGVVYGVW
jgi:folate-dependent phosphoribosylglycinamide formyltransferase PurN